MGAISSSSVNSAAASGNLVITAPASIVAGNLLVMICYNSGGGATVTPDTDWFLQIDSGVSNSSQAWVYTKTATISEPSTYTFNFDTSYNAMVCLQYPPLFVDSYIVNLDITDTLLTSAFSAYYSADQIVVGAGCGGGFTLATPTGLTLQNSTASYSNESLYAFDATALSTSIPSYSGLWSGSSAWTSIVFALSATPPPSGASLTSDFSANGDADYTPPSYGSLTSDFFSSSVGTVTPPPPPPLPSQLSALPTLNVYIAFEPTYGGATLNTANMIALSNPYWTSITEYVQDFTTATGKQHFIDRVESSTVHMTLNNRNGFFSGSPYLINTRLPIAITATWSGITYPIFWGITDSIEEQIADQLNSELRVGATDLSKYLSLRNLSSNSFWSKYTEPASGNTMNWFQLQSPQTAVVTGAEAVHVGSSYNITYNGINNFSVGQNVTVSNLTLDTFGGSTGNFNVQNAPITAVTSTTFTVNITFPATTGLAYGSGSAYISTLTDQTGSAMGNASGIVSFPSNGAVIYNPTGCIDLGTSGTNFFTGLPTVGGGEIIANSSSTPGGLDFWINSANMNGQTIITVPVINGPGLWTLNLFVDPIGELVCGVYNTQVTPITISNYVGNAKVSGNFITDGYWHHIGLITLPTGFIELYVDGVFATGSASLASFGNFNFDTMQFSIGFDGIKLEQNCLSAQIDEIIMSTETGYSTLKDEVLLRYRAGTLLQLGHPVDTTSFYSGDRIAEVLCIAGYGDIELVSGTPTVVLPTGLFNIATGYKTYSSYVYGNVNGSCQVEPYYWDSPVISSSALSLIQQITDTDIGSFFQGPDGMFYFNPQYYYGTWLWDGPSGTNTGPYPYTGTWTPGSFSPSGYSVWTDDGSGVPYYGQSLQVTRDDVDLWTTVKVTPQSGSEQIYENTSAEGLYGFSTLQKSSTVPTSLDASLSAANFLGYLFRSPLPRVQGVELQAEAFNGSYIPAVIGTKFSDVVTFKRTMPNASGSGIINSIMVVESISHDFKADPGQWHTTFILDPYPVRS